MRVPSNVLRKIRIECGTFASEESGTGVSDYGAIFALLMMVAGVGAGWFLLSSAPGPSVNTVEHAAGSTPAACAAKPVPPRFDEPCQACGGG